MTLTKKLLTGLVAATALPLVTVVACSKPEKPPVPPVTNDFITIPDLAFRTEKTWAYGSSNPDSYEVAFTGFTFTPKEDWAAKAWTQDDITVGAGTKVNGVVQSRNDLECSIFAFEAVDTTKWTFDVYINGITEACDVVLTFNADDGVTTHTQTVGSQTTDKLSVEIETAPDFPIGTTKDTFEIPKVIHQVSSLPTFTPSFTNIEGNNWLGFVVSANGTGVDDQLWMYADETKQWMAGAKAGQYFDRNDNFTFKWLKQGSESVYSTINNFYILPNESEPPVPPVTDDFITVPESTFRTEKTWAYGSSNPDSYEVAFTGFTFTPGKDWAAKSSWSESDFNITAVVATNGVVQPHNALDCKIFKFDKVGDANEWTFDVYINGISDDSNVVLTIEANDGVTTHTQEVGTKDTDKLFVDVIDAPVMSIESRHGTDTLTMPKIFHQDNEGVPTNVPTFTGDYWLLFVVYKGDSTVDSNQIWIYVMAEDKYYPAPFAGQVFDRNDHLLFEFIDENFEHGLVQCEDYSNIYVLPPLM